MFHYLRTNNYPELICTVLIIYFNLYYINNLFIRTYYVGIWFGNHISNKKAHKGLQTVAQKLK